MRPIKYLSAILMMLAFAACDKDDEVTVPELKFATEMLSVNADGGIVAVDVNANIPYEVVMPQDAEWVKLTGEAMPEVAKLSFEVEKNTTGTARMAAVVIRASEGIISTDTLRITQSGLADTADITAEFDPAFAELLMLLDLIPDNRHITYGDVKNIDMVDCDWDDIEISSVRGLEYLEALTYLNVNNNPITSLDVSKNKELETLYCKNAALTSLDVSHNTKLIRLECQNNKLSSLNINNCAELTKLYCGNNQLTHLNLDQNPMLEELDANNNSLSELDVSKNVELKELSCARNNLESLNLSKNTELTSLMCSRTSLTSLDVSQNAKLEGLYCESNQLISLDVSRNTNLEALYCSNNQLTSLDVRHSPHLKYLFCGENRIASLDLENSELTLLRCDKNLLTTLDMSRCAKLETLYCNQNLLPGIDISHNKAVNFYHCSGNSGQEGCFVVTVWPGCEVKMTDEYSKELTSWDYDGQTIFVRYVESEK